MKRSGLILLITGIILNSCSSIAVRDADRQLYLNSLGKKEQKLYMKVHSYLTKSQRGETEYTLFRGTALDSLSYDPKEKNLDLYFNKRLVWDRIRSEDVEGISADLKKHLGWRYRHWTVTLHSSGYPLHEHIPNIYRPTGMDIDHARKQSVKHAGERGLVRPLDRPFSIHAGLQGRHIAMWHSHGWYYSNWQKRWEWERARLWQTVEDLYPLSYTVPYLYPMLEKAGAVVMVPRERDPQVHSCVVDNDSPDSEGQYRESGLLTDISSRPGYSDSLQVLDKENPFRLGTAVQFRSNPEASGEISWTPDIPEDGIYAVYVSYQQDETHVTDARYTVHHEGGRTRFAVDQTRGGGTWIYLGSFPFRRGSDPEFRQVTLSDESADSGRIVSADAVRFGGGMGNIAREGRLSRRARFYEASRYYLQYAGMPDSLVYSFHEDTLDYNDDYKSRGEWVNYLMGAPNGPIGDRTADGLNIPVDLSLAFHTDAGITRDGSTVGTLVIYSSEGLDSLHSYPDGRPRIAGRDYADMMQTQIVDDIRAKYNSRWNRRGIWNSLYSEAGRPNAPGMILELLSHQNFEDMKYGLDPMFHFDVSRSIYKSMLRFIAYQSDYEPVIQPLPVSHFHGSWNSDSSLTLSWRPVEDPLEPTAHPDSYVLYTRPEGSDFDNGRLLRDATVTLRDLQPGLIYSFKITAVNAGGEGFPSEILSACLLDSSAGTALIINAFDRISGPAHIETAAFSGFLNFLDEGVPYGIDHSFIGTQYDFDPDSPWQTNDISGHGASFSNFETTAIAGNTFDYPLIHGESLRAAGWSFVSASDESVEEGLLKLREYVLIDVIAGEEKYSPWQVPEAETLNGPRFQLFTAQLSSALTDYALNGGKLLVSGAYIASDPEEHSAHIDSLGQLFTRNILGIKLARKNASRSSGLFSDHPLFMPIDRDFHYNVQFRPDIYKVEAPDEINAADSSSVTVARFSENHFSCAVLKKTEKYSALSMSVPFETILDRDVRDQLMKGAIRLLFQPLPSEHSLLDTHTNKSSYIDP